LYYLSNPKNNNIASILVKEHPEILSNNNSLQLVRMRGQIKNIFGGMYGVNNNNNIFSVRDLNSLINTISRRK